MADHSKGGLFAKAAKRMARTKAKVLQNLGKAEITKDESFDEHVQNFQKQQSAAIKLHKELKNYVQCAKTMLAASKEFCDTISETYEGEWTDQNNVNEIIQSLDLLWGDYNQRLADQVTEPLSTYLTRFPDFRNRISKRRRKLVDFDNAKHNLEILVGAKKKDETKINKAQEELGESKRIYDDLNAELHADLPAFYQSRVPFYGSLFNNLFSAETTVHSEVGRLTGTLSEISEQLFKDNAQYQYTARAPVHRLMSSSGSDDHNINGTGDDQTNSLDRVYSVPNDSPELTKATKSDEVEPAKSANSAQVDFPTSRNGTNENEAEDSVQPETEQTYTELEVVKDDKVVVNGDARSEDLNASLPDSAEESNPKSNTLSSEDENLYSEPAPLETSEKPDKQDEEEEANYQTPMSNKPVEPLPEGVLFLVEATHPYNSEDMDELTFEAGETIYVVPYDDPEEQDTGWLMGYKTEGGKRGVFPENFTKSM